MEEDVDHACQMDAHLVDFENNDRVYWHGLISTSVLEVQNGVVVGLPERKKGRPPSEVRP